MEDYTHKVTAQEYHTNQFECLEGILNEYLILYLVIIYIHIKPYHSNLVFVNMVLISLSIEALDHSHEVAGVEDVKKLLKSHAFYQVEKPRVFEVKDKPEGNQR